MISIRRLLTRTYRLVSINVQQFLLPVLSLRFLQILVAPAFSNPSSISSSEEEARNRLVPATSATPSTSANTKSASACSSNRIFVAGLSQECTKQLLHQAFVPYGTITDMSIIGFDDKKSSSTSKSKKSSTAGKRKPFAFVTFDSQQSALAAISDATNGSILQPLDNMFQQVKTAIPLDSSKRKKSNNLKRRQQNHLEDRKDIFTRTNLILQVQSTHVDRLEDYLNYAIKLRDPHVKFHLEGSEGSARNNMSLMFLSVCNPNPTELAMRLGEDQTIARALKKAYVVDNGCIEAQLSSDSGCEVVVGALLERVNDYYDNIGGSKDRSFKMHVFPPSNQGRLLSALDRIENSIIDTKPSSTKSRMRMDPKEFTDVVSIVEVLKYKGRNSEEKDEAYVMTGFAQSFTSDYHINREIMSDGAVCRAYFKLKEAVDRYQNDHADMNFKMFENTVALDCGSAPGGWTKYLAQDMKCKLVHSVDPGNLDADVMELDNVNHLRMKIQDAIPLLKKEQSKINVFVSDACLHEMEGQVEFLLLAKESGILNENAFFVLTLKCTTGYSKAYFDSQAMKVVKSLNARAQTSGVSTYHLFSNRNGERTLMGFLSESS